MKNERSILFLFVLVLSFFTSINYLNATTTLTFKGPVQGYCGEGINPIPVVFQLHNSESPYLVEAESFAFLNTKGDATVTFNGPIGDYYIGVKGWNILDTWSLKTFNFINSGTLLYYLDITTAWGSNMTSWCGSWCIYVGDVDQDRTMGGSDAAMIDNAAYWYTIGQVVTDLDGNLLVDGTDLQIIDNNVYNFVTAIP